MAQLQMFLFGSPRLTHKGRDVEIGLRKALAIFIYLAVTRQPHSRDALATLFWPESDQRSARASLRRTLYQITQAVGADVLAVSTEMVALADGADLWLDAGTFRQILDDCLPAAVIADLPDTALTQLEAAMALYTGEFLAGFSLPDCPDFDEWRFFQQEELRQMAVKALEQLVLGHQSRDQFKQAIDHGRHWLALDPVHEPAHRHLMRLYAWSGQQAAALRQYEECARILDKEFGGLPEDETTALHEAIRTKRFPMATPEREQASRDVAAATLAMASPLQPWDAVSFHLPIDPHPFVGRQTELSQLYNLVRNPHCRLITITGMGGMGKTSLALEFAHHLRHQHPHTFPDGIVFVPLVDVDAGASVVPSLVSILAGALNLPLAAHANPLQQLLDILRPRQMLLILDNVEHLLQTSVARRVGESVVDLISTMLEIAGQIKLLVTSREPLRLNAEWRLDLEGLDYPREDTLVDDQIARSNAYAVEGYSAVQLFCQFAQQFQSTFQMTPNTAPWIGRLCHRVMGSPLALKLAAAWVRLFSCQRIVAGIEENIDILSTKMRDVPVRQRSIRAVFDYTWDLLVHEEQHLFCRLSVFHGGFDEKAAIQVAGATLPRLARLLDRGLIEVQAQVQGIRYRLHELIHQYATEKLLTLPEIRDQTQAAHAGHYLDLVVVHSKRLKNNERATALPFFSTEFANIRAAWRWAVSASEVQTLRQCALPLSDGLEKQAEEGLVLFQQAAACLDEANPMHRAALGTLLVAQAEQRMRLGHNPTQSVELTERALALLHDTDAPDAVYKALGLQGNAFWIQGNYERAKAVLEEGLTFVRRRGITSATGEFLIRLGLVEREIHNGQAVTAFYQNSFEELRRLNDPINLAHQLLIYGEYLVVHGQPREGQRFLVESRTLAQTVGGVDFFPFVLLHLGFAAYQLGDYAGAARYFHEVLAVAQAEARVHPQALAHLFLGRVNTAQGAFADAAHHLTKGLQLGQRHQLTLVITLALVCFAEFYTAQQEAALAVRLLAVALHHPATEQRDRQEAQTQLQVLQSKVPSDEFTQIMASSTQLSLADVVA